MGFNCLALVFLELLIFTLEQLILVAEELGVVLQLPIFCLCLLKSNSFVLRLTKMLLKLGLVLPGLLELVVILRVGVGFALLFLLKFEVLFHEKIRLIL